MKTIFLMQIAFLFSISNIEAHSFRNKEKPSVYISGYSKDYHQLDITIGERVTIDESSISELINPKPPITVSNKSKNGYFGFDLNNIYSAKYIGFQLLDPEHPDKRESSQFFIIDPEDSISFSYKDNKLYFNGRNANKFNCQVNINEAYISPVFLALYQYQNNLESCFKRVDSLMLNCFNILDHYKSKISKQTYSQIKSDILSRFYNAKIINLKFYGHLSDGKYDYLNSIENYKDQVWNVKVSQAFEKSYGLNNTTYLDFLQLHYLVDSCYFQKKPISSTMYFDDITARTSGPSREFVIYKLITIIRTSQSDKSDCAEMALKRGYIKNKYLKSYLIDVKNKAPGSLAFEFSLPDTSGTIVHQSDLKGKIILIDTWFFGCGNCIALHPILDSIKESLNIKNFQVVSVCLGNDLPVEKEKWLNEIRSGNHYTNSHNLNLLENSKNSPFINHYRINASPTLILISRDGILTEQPIDPRIDQGKSLIRIIQANL